MVPPLSDIAGIGYSGDTAYNTTLNPHQEQASYNISDVIQCYQCWLLDTVVTLHTIPH